jgi:hypothetical protein
MLARKTIRAVRLFFITQIESNQGGCGRRKITGACSLAKAGGAIVGP